MAENSEEINVLAHLLQVEKDASYLIDDAVKVAEEKLTQARAEFNLKYKEKYEAILSVLEEDYKESLENLQNEHNAKIQNFKSEILAQNQDKQAFNNLLDKLLFQSN